MGELPRQRQSPSPQSSIFQLAYSHGWSGPAGHALDWGDELSAGPGAQTEGRAGRPPLGGSPRAGTCPTQWHPAEQLKRYLQALFEPDEYVAYVTESFMAADRRRPAKGCWDSNRRAAHRRAGRLRRRRRQGHGRLRPRSRCVDLLQPGGRHRPQGCQRHQLTATPSWSATTWSRASSWPLIQQLELPCAALVYSGGKSVHAIVRGQCAGLCRIPQAGRLPLRHLPEERSDPRPAEPQPFPPLPDARHPAGGDKQQALLETNVGKSCWEDWRDWVEACTDDLPDTECLADDWDEPAPAGRCPHLRRAAPRATRCCWQAPPRQARASPSSSCASPSPRARRGLAASPAHRGKCTLHQSGT